MKVKKKNKRGVTLIYVIIISTIISGFMFGFIYFVNERNKIYYLKKNLKNKEKIQRDYLIYKEEQNSERIKEKGIKINGERKIPDKKEEYFNSAFIADITGNTEVERLLFLNENNVSIGGFKIKEIKDSEGKSYALPLEKNTVYRTLNLIYSKEILNSEVFYSEKITFIRKNVMRVEIITEKQELF